MQAFRREESIQVTARFKLQGLDHGAHYLVEDLDGEKMILSGAVLMDEGLVVSAKKPSSALVLTYTIQK